MSLLFLPLLLSGKDLEWTLQEDGWLRGVFRETVYSENLDGLTLAPPELSPLWSAEFPGLLIADLVLDAEGRIFAVGAKEDEGNWKSWFGIIRSGGEVAWETTRRTLSSQLVALTWSPRGYLVATGWSGEGVLLSAISPYGLPIWRQEIGAEGKALGSDLVATDTAIYVAGVTWDHGEKRGLILKCDHKGEPLWSRVLDPDTEAFSIAALSGGGMAVLWRNAERGGVVALDGEGDPLWRVELPPGFRPRALLDHPDGLLVLGERISGDRSVVVYRIGPGGLAEVAEYPSVQTTIRAAAVAGSGGLLLGCENAGEARIFLLHLRRGLLGERALGWDEDSGIQALACEGARCVVAGTARSQGKMGARLVAWKIDAGARKGEYVSPIKDWGHRVELESLYVRGKGLRMGEVRLVLELSTDGFASTVARVELAPEEEIPLKDLPPARYTRLIIRISGDGESPVVEAVRVRARPYKPALAKGERKVTGEETKPVSQPSIGGPEISVNPLIGLAGETTFRFSPEGKVSAGCVWEFGDGDKAKGDSVTHVYARPGTYEVRLVGREGNTLASREVTVYGGEWRSVLLPFQVKGAPISGDFNGDGWADLALWVPGQRTIFLFSGTGDGGFSLQSNRQLMGAIQSVRVLDLDGDGLDDLIALQANLEDGIWYLRGSPSTLLEPARRISVPIGIAYLVEAENELILFGRDVRGNNALCRIGWENGAPKVDVLSVSENLPFIGVVPLGEEDKRVFCVLFEHSGWVLHGDDAGTKFPSFTEILGIGDFDGEGMEDAVTVSHDGVWLWLREKHRMLLLSPFSQDDRWVTADLDGNGVDEVIGLGPQGHMSVYFLVPARGKIALPSPTPGEYTLLPLDLEGDGKEELLLFSGGGNSYIFRLTLGAPSEG